MGRARAVPYKGMGSVHDEGWLDDICFENRKAEIHLRKFYFPKMKKY